MLHQPIFSTSFDDFLHQFLINNIPSLRLQFMRLKGEFSSFSLSIEVPHQLPNFLMKANKKFQRTKNGACHKP